MTLSVQKLRGVINLLSDPLQAGNAAFILTREAKERGVLVADLMLLVSSASTSSAQTYRPPPPPPKPEPTAEPTSSDVKSYDDRAKPFTKSLGDGDVGLASAILSETPKAWLVAKPDGTKAWLAKSQVLHRGEDRRGRAYFSIPAWLAKRIKLAA